MSSKRSSLAPKAIRSSKKVPELLKPPFKKDPLEICLDFGQVMITGPLGKVDAKDVGKVRAHAMRQHHHKRRAKPKDLEDVEVEVVKQKRQVELGKLVHVHSRFQPSPLGSGRNDPFIRLPVANPPKRYYELIDHCKSFHFLFFSSQ